MFGFIIGPALPKLSPASSGEFFVKVAPRIVRFFQIAAGSTILFGALLAYTGISNGDFPGLSLSTTWGLSLTIGLVLGLVTFLIGELVAIPELNRVVKIIRGMQAGGASGSPEDLNRALRRARLTGNATVVLLLLTLVFMIGAGFY